MSRLIFILILITSKITFSASPIADSNELINKVNQDAAQSILNFFSGCNQKVWPQFDLNDLNIVFLTNSTDELVSVSFKEKKIFTTSASSIDSRRFKSLYSIYKIDGQKWLSINSSKLAAQAEKNKKLNYEFLKKSVLELLIHEAFHASAQTNWKELVTERGTLLPIQWEPRFLRYKIYKLLLQALESNNEEETLLVLKKVSYWYNKWKIHFPDEVIYSTDISEGTAQYVELSALVFLNNSCDIEPVKFFKEILNIYKNERSEFINAGYFSLDTEGYEIGALAGFLIDKIYTSKKWKELMSSGEVLQLEILLKNIEPTDASPDPEDESLIEQFKLTQINSKNAVDDILKSHFNNLSRNHVNVGIPLKYGAGAVSYYDFYIDPTKKVSYSPLESEVYINKPHGLTNFKIAADTVLFSPQDIPCENSYTYVAISSTSLKSIGASLYEINSNEIIGQVNAEPVEYDNRTWLCPK